MDSTSSRIQSLEKEFDAMKRFISKESEKQKSDWILESKSRSVMDSARPASFHGVHQQSGVNKTQRGERRERGSVSSLSTTFRRRGASPPPQSQLRCEKSLRKRLIKGIKNVFSTSSKQGAKRNAFTVEEIYDGLEDFVWIKDNDDTEKCDLDSLKFLQGQATASF